jgi:hypothetical protein
MCHTSVPTSCSTPEAEPGDKGLAPRLSAAMRPPARRRSPAPASRVPFLGTAPLLSSNRRDGCSFLSVRRSAFGGRVPAAQGGH